MSWPARHVEPSVSATAMTLGTEYAVLACLHIETNRVSVMIIIQHLLLCVLIWSWHKIRADRALIEAIVPPHTMHTCVCVCIRATIIIIILNSGATITAIKVKKRKLVNKSSEMNRSWQHWLLQYSSQLLVTTRQQKEMGNHCDTCKYISIYIMKYIWSKNNAKKKWM